LSKFWDFDKVYDAKAICASRTGRKFWQSVATVQSARALLIC